MTFAARVKEEICAGELEGICCVRAQLAGMVSFAAYLENDLLALKTENKSVSSQFCFLVKRLYNLDAETETGKGSICSVGLSGPEATKILRDMRLTSIPLRIENSIIRGSCCKKAFVQGAFLGAGSISDPQKGYHAEFVTSRFGLCKDFDDILMHLGIKPRKVNRKSKYVFYIKNSGQIETLLAVLGSHTQMMEFINVKIEKELRNTTNRLVNCENANSEKRAEAAVMQMRALSSLGEKIGFENLPVHLSQVAKMRMENPEASLTEMALALGISKSGVNHRLRRLIQMANEKNGE